MPRKSMAEQLRAAVGERLNDATLDKVIRNAASSWSQAGHLSGRTSQGPPPGATTPPQWRSHCISGPPWAFVAKNCSPPVDQVLDCTPSQALELAIEAKRLGLLDLRVAGDVFAST